MLDSRSDRIDARIPFFTPVVASRLKRCWATNISASGIGLTGFVAAEPGIQPGDDLQLELQLGETKQTLRVTGRVAWTSAPRPDGRIGIGAHFLDLSAASRGMLVRFLAQHRPRVIIALASAADEALARRALDQLQVEVVQDINELDQELVRASSTILVFSSDEDQLNSFLEVLSRFQAEESTFPGELPGTPVMVCTSIQSEGIVALLSSGQIQEVLRPPLERHALALAVERSCERWALQLERRWASLQLEGLASGQEPRTVSPPAIQSTGSSKVVRVSAAMQRAYELIATVAVHDVPVLLCGETGTGKELAAREIHALSKRAHTPFVAQDCGAMTETLLESELFGHVRGAFTGATTDHPGLFQIADGGTIFLDEIQNTSPGLQAKLLRVVEEGEVRPVGSAKPRHVSVRLIAACNVDLKQAVRDLRFRADFYYRLNRFPVDLPPLREHRDDIIPLFRFFIGMLCEQMERSIPEVDPAVEGTLMAHSWPGNIRELKNAIERALLLTRPGEPLRCAVLPDDVRTREVPEGGAPQGLSSLLDQYERRLIKDALDRNEGVIRRAAKELEINAVTLSRRMRRLGLT